MRSCASSTARICSGDSGGPVLDLDASRIYAVLSAERVDDRENLAITTQSELDWIKSFVCPSTARNQCTGDGDLCSCSARTDILWRNAGGQLAIWFEGQPEGAAFPSYHNSGLAVPLSFQVRGLGDFDGDGSSDILWQGADGQMAIWNMVNGVMVDESYPGGQVPSSWKVQGVADFDADGRSDILWRDDAGQLAIWFEGDNGLAQYPGYDNVPAPVSTVWQVQGLGDFDGDEHADIVWRNMSDGQFAIWRMDGHWRVGEETPGPQDPTLFSRIQAIGDFDGNLRSDILFRDGDGVLDIWFDGESEGFGGPSYDNKHEPVSDPAWKVVGVGDFDRDRREDILWRHSSGQLAIWLLGGVRFIGDLYPGAPDNGWQIQGLSRESGL